MYGGISIRTSGALGWSDSEWVCNMMIQPSLWTSNVTFGIVLFNLATLN